MQSFGQRKDNEIGFLFIICTLFILFSLFKSIDLLADLFDKQPWYIDTLAGLLLLLTIYKIGDYYDWW